MDKRQEALLLALKPFLRKERQERSTGRCMRRGWQVLRVWL